MLSVFFLWLLQLLPLLCFVVPCMAIDVFDPDVKLLTRFDVVKFMQKQWTIRINPGSVIRWMLTGSGGIKLENIKLNGKRYTNLESLKRFVEQTQPENKPATATSSPGIEGTPR